MPKQFLLRNISRKVSIFLEIDLHVMLRIKKDRATRFIVRQTSASIVCSCSCYRSCFCGSSDD